MKIVVDPAGDSNYQTFFNQLNVKLPQDQKLRFSIQRNVMLLVEVDPANGDFDELLGKAMRAYNFNYGGFLVRFLDRPEQEVLQRLERLIDEVTAFEWQEKRLE